MNLYDVPRSGNCHKVRLLLSIAGIEYDRITIDFQGLEHKSPEHIARNPRGQVPVLDDSGHLIHDSQAILTYLATKYPSARNWLPTDAEGLADVVSWLSFAANEIAAGPMTARGINKLGRAGNLDEAQAKSLATLAILDGQLTANDWLAAGHSTIADLACYPYVGLAPQGGIDLKPYAGIVAWLRRIESLPGYVGMDGLPAQVG